MFSRSVREENRAITMQISQRGRDLHLSKFALDTEPEITPHLSLIAPKKRGTASYPYTAARRPLA